MAAYLRTHICRHRSRIKNPLRMGETGELSALLAGIPAASRCKLQEGLFLMCSVIHPGPIALTFWVIQFIGKFNLRR